VLSLLFSKGSMDGVIIENVLDNLEIQMRCRSNQNFFLQELMVHIAKRLNQEH